MLSKAAFNAFLKILEEPPNSTIFILATTEIQKIPETVRSRCFQVLFNPVQNDVLFAHLQKICSTETIDAEEDAIKLLVQENDGSVRDAINTLEQVRFSGQKITTELVLSSLGKLSETKLFTLVNAIVDQKPKALLDHLQEIKFENLSAQNLWNTIVQALRNVLWVKYGVSGATYDFDKGNLEYIAQKCTINRINALMQILWSQESLFLQTPKKHVFLEIVLLQMCHQVNIEDIKVLLDACQNPQSAPRPQTQPNIPTIPKALAPPVTQVSPVVQAPWSSFVSDIEKQANDPLLSTIFKQAQFVGTENNKSKVKLQLANNNSFLRDKLKDTESLWKPVLKKYFTTFDSFEFTVAPVAQQATAPKPQNYQSQTKKLKFVDTSNKEKWPKANLLTRHFSGKIEKE
jgi:DNA polymerase-3 subunit gamma/tau